MKNHLVHISLFFSLTFSTITFAQQKVAYDGNKKYSISELKADLATYKTQLEKVHTGLTNSNR